MLTRYLFDDPFDALFDTRPLVRGPTHTWDVHEDQYVMSIDLPGTAEEDIDIQTQNGMLSIQAERTKGSNGHRSWTRFSRTFRIPQGGDIDGVCAEYTQGVLTVCIPKLEAAKPRKIEVVNRQQLQEDNS